MIIVVILLLLLAPPVLVLALILVLCALTEAGDEALAGCSHVLIEEGFKLSVSKEGDDYCCDLEDDHHEANSHGVGV